MISSKLIKKAFYLNKFEPDFKSILKNLKIGSYSSMNQTHSNKVLFTDLGNEYNCDSLITRQKNHALLVKTADCMPILLNDGIHVGAVHSGWRGVDNEIFENTLKNFEIKNLKVSIGPHAQSCCYEIQNDVYQRLGEFVKIKEKKYYLKLSNKIQKLSEKYLFKLEISKYCTICDKNYFSYRENKTSERQYSLIWQ